GIQVRLDIAAEIRRSYQTVVGVEPKRLPAPTAAPVLSAEMVTAEHDRFTCDRYCVFAAQLDEGFTKGQQLNRLRLSVREPVTDHHHLNREGHVAAHHKKVLRNILRGVAAAV